jgi:hypothetical protein
MLLVAWEEGKPIPVPGQLAGGKVVVVHHPILKMRIGPENRPDPVAKG